jgi:hypothetical protein
VEGPLANARLAALAKEPDLKPSVLSEEEARQALARGRVVLVVSAGETPVYSYDPTQPESRAARWRSMQPYNAPQGVPMLLPPEARK